MLVASLAREDRQVEAFRADVLRGQLLGDVAAAAEWIRERAGEEGRSLYSTITLDDDDIRDGSDGSAYIDGRFDVSSVDTAMLRFVNPAEDRVDSVAVHHGGILDRLRRISEDLAASFPWQAAQATIFLLTDMVPQPPTLRVGLKMAGSLRLRPDDKGSSSCGPTMITMEIDPDVPPAEVEAAYRRRRLQVLGGGQAPAGQRQGSEAGGVLRCPPRVSLARSVENVEQGPSGGRLPRPSHLPDRSNSSARSDNEVVDFTHQPSREGRLT